MNTYYTQTYIGSGVRFLLSVAFIILCSFLATQHNIVQAQGAASSTSTSTATFELTKVIDQAGFTGNLSASDFIFHITGNGINESVNHGGEIELPVGTYSVIESATTAFDPAKWTVLWAGDLCSGHYPATEAGNVVVTVSDVENNMSSNPYRCTAQNQYKPGRIEVVKEIVGTSTSPTQFSFSVNGDTSIAFDDSGRVEVEVGAGTYEVIEEAAPGYTTTYAGCSGTIENFENVTCTITNTYNGTQNVCDDPAALNYQEAGACEYPQPDTCDDINATNYGEEGDCEYGGGGSADSYRIEGYVWHDDNENKEWDGFVDGDEDFDQATTTASTTEEALSGWTVIITNGSSEFSTTTDPNGYYYFEVPAGTWTISEVIKTGWKLTTPTDNSHVVTVPEVVAQSVWQKFVTMMMPTAKAATVKTFGLFNFGNNQTSGGGTGGDGGGGGGNNSGVGGGSVSPHCELFELTSVAGASILNWETRFGDELFITQDGVEIFRTTVESEVDENDLTVITADATFELTVLRGNRDDSCDITPSTSGGGNAPVGQVLGDQVSVVPLGAAAAGGGGGAPKAPTSPVTVLALLTRAVTRVTRYV